MDGSGGLITAPDGPPAISHAVNVEISVASHCISTGVSQRTKLLDSGKSVLVQVGVDIGLQYEVQDEDPTFPKTNTEVLDNAGMTL